MLKDFIGFDDRVCYGLCRAVASSAQEMIGFSDTEVVKKDLVQFVIIVLSGMNQYMIGLMIEPIDHATHLDQFRPCADNCHGFAQTASPKSVP